MDRHEADENYSLALDRSMTIDAILALDKRLTREYLNTLTTDALHDLEEAELNTLHSS